MCQISLENRCMHKSMLIYFNTTASRKDSAKLRRDCRWIFYINQFTKTFFLLTFLLLIFRQKSRIGGIGEDLYCVLETVGMGKDLFGALCSKEVLIFTCSFKKSGYETMINRWYISIFCTYTSYASLLNKGRNLEIGGVMRTLKSFIWKMRYRMKVCHLSGYM